MKKLILIFTMIFAAAVSFAQNYNNGNGTIIAEETSENDGLRIVRRRHVQTVTMSEHADIPETNKALWKYYTYLYNTKRTLEQEFGITPLIDDCSGKEIHIMEILKISNVYVAEHDPNYPYYPYYAYYVEVEGQKGYMYAERDDSEVANFYDKGYWSVEGSIFSSGKQWTIRNARHSGDFIIAERLFVRDKPGTKGTNKIYLFYKDTELPEEAYLGTDVEVINVTEEQETIDGKTGRWLEIVYKDIRGWVFEGYVYYSLYYGWSPEDCIEQQFTWGYR